MRPISLVLLLASLALGAAGCGFFGKTEAQAPTPEPEKPKGFSFREISLKGTGTDAFVLMYHDVVEKRTSETLWYDSTAEDIQKDLTKLQDWGATFISLEDLYQALAEGKPLPPRSVAITYDDNYQGFYDHAWPLYQAQKIPVTMFVHTNFIGSKQGRPKMTEETLKELLKSGHFAIGGHTKSHPDDFKALTPEKQTEELVESRDLLEKTFGMEVRDLAWPVGSYSTESMRIAKEAGYRMAFTMDSGLAWTSPSMLEVRRYNPTKIDDALKAADAQGSDPLGYTSKPWVGGTVRREEGRFAGVPLALVRGGKPKTVLVAGRESVSDLVSNFNGVAGINGGFFLISDIVSNDNRMIGPCLTSNVDMWFPDLDGPRLLKLINRPFVLFTEEGISIAPFRPAYNKQADVEATVGKITDAFVGGAWLVHQGVARTKEQIMSAATSDAMDFRRRAFMGISAEGELILGACTGSYDSERLAKAAVEAGCVEAILLDSGFSTSLVYEDKILASGHATKAKPSRPVPHAIIVEGSTSEAPGTDATGTTQSPASP